MATPMSSFASPPHRIRVVGTSGSGKSRLAVRLAAALDLPRLELDAVFWDAGWVKRPLVEAHTIIENFIVANPDGWVVEGNWFSSLQGRLDPGGPQGADVTVWLDHSRMRVLGRVIRRTLRRGLTRQQLWHGNRERISTWWRLSPDENIVLWSWTSHPRVRADMLARIVSGEPVVHLRGQRAVEEWLADLTNHSPSEGAR